MDEKELQDEATWDFERAERVPPVPASKRRAVVSVAFKIDDFTMIAEYARRAGMKLSEFIRGAALEAAGLGQIEAEVMIGGESERSQVTVQTGKVPPSTNGRWTAEVTAAGAIAGPPEQVTTD